MDLDNSSEINKINSSDNPYVKEQSVNFRHLEKHLRVLFLLSYFFNLLFFILRGFQLFADA
jgi:hypothetical protein